MPKVKLAAAATGATEQPNQAVATAADSGDSAGKVPTGTATASGDESDPDAASDDDGDAGGDDGEPSGSGSAAPETDGGDSGSAAAEAGGSSDGAAAAPAAKTLADYRAAFGHEQGSVLYADQVPFLDACVKHIEGLNGRISDLQATNEKLTQQNTLLASQIHGETTPVETGAETGADPKTTRLRETRGDARGEFAASLKLPTESAG